jgi:hypothetical protein
MKLYADYDNNRYFEVIRDNGSGLMYCVEYAVNEDGNFIVTDQDARQTRRELLKLDIINTNAHDLTADKLYTVREAAAVLNRSKQTVMAYIHGGLLKARKLKPDAANSKFVITESDLRDFINGQLDEDGNAPRGYYQKLYPRPHKR